MEKFSSPSTEVIFLEIAKYFSDEKGNDCEKLEKNIQYYFNNLSKTPLLRTSLVVKQVLEQGALWIVKNFSSAKLNLAINLLSQVLSNMGYSSQLDRNSFCII